MPAPENAKWRALPGGVRLIIAAAAEGLCAVFVAQGCSRPTAVRPTAARAVLCENGRVVHDEALPVDGEFERLFSQWQAERDGWRPSLATYAPGLVLRVNDEPTINFAGGGVVVNDGRGQRVREARDGDRALKAAVLDRMGTTPIGPD